MKLWRRKPRPILRICLEIASMALNLLHLADIHFGMENYGRLDPATGLNRRLLDFSRSVHHAIDYALEHDVHLAIFAGDIYKHRDPEPSWQREFARCVNEIRRIERPAFGFASRARFLEERFVAEETHSLFD